MPTFWPSSHMTAKTAREDQWKKNGATTAPRWNGAMTAKNTQLNLSVLLCTNSGVSGTPGFCCSAINVVIESPPPPCIDRPCAFTCGSLADGALPSSSTSTLTGSMHEQNCSHGRILEGP